MQIYKDEFINPQDLKVYKAYNEVIVTMLNVKF